jgi:hypothetical protein
MAVYDYGLAKPGAAPALNNTGTAGSHPAGKYFYRVRWKDADLNALSLPSASASVTHTDTTKAIRVTQPSSPPGRATHWIIERTTDGGGDPAKPAWIPLNVNETTPHGTLIGTTTYDDNTDDQTLLGNIGLQYPETQMTLQRPLRQVFASKNSFFFVGGRVHRVTATLTNGLPTVSGGSGFNNYMGDINGAGGQDLKVPADADGRSYRIFSTSSSTDLTLATNYVGTTGLKEIAISGERDVVLFSEPGVPESLGQNVLGIPFNRLRIGDDGEPLVGGMALGPAGNLYAKEQSLYFHPWTRHPAFAPRGDGILQKLATRRGALGPLAMKFVDGYGYGIDGLGVWRLSPGGEPQEIGQRIAGDWKTETLNLNQGDNFLIERDQATRTLWFFVVQTGQTYPRTAYVLNLDTQEWIYTRVFGADVVASCELPDSNGLYHMCLWLRQEDGKSYLWMHGRADADGVDITAVSDLYGTASGGNTGTLQNNGASWPTTEPKLRGVPVWVRHADGTEETRSISDNTNTQLTFAGVMSSAVASGDTYVIGGIPTEYKTGRMFCGAPDRKKQFRRAYILVKFDGQVTDLNVSAYFDGSSTANADAVVAQAEDGVTRAIASSEQAFTPSDSQYIRYAFSLGNTWANDLQLKFFSRRPGKPWEILAVVVDYEFEQKADPKR